MSITIEPPIVVENIAYSKTAHSSKVLKSADNDYCSSRHSITVGGLLVSYTFYYFFSPRLLASQ